MVYASLYALLSLALEFNSYLKGDTEMAYTEKEIRQAYLEDITHYCPKKKTHGVWQNTVVKRGKLSEELVDAIEGDKT